MSEIHAHIELALLIVASTLSTSFHLAKLVLLAYEDMKQTLKKVRKRRDYDEQ